MELRHLRYFLAVARRSSFTRAAEELSIAQPALSQQIASLERELGVRLLDRNNRSVALTDAGRALLPRAERMLHEAAAAAEEMAAFAGGRRGRVVVGTYQSFAEFTLPKLLGTFHKRHPGIDVALREGLAGELLEALRAGTIDLFVGDLSPAFAAAAREFDEEPLFEDELAIAVAPGHRLAARASVSIAELRDEAFVVFRSGSSIFERLQMLARAAGFEPRAAFESLDSLTIRSLVAENLGVALFPRMLGNVPGPRIWLLSLTPHKEMRRMSLVTRRAPAGSAARSFIAFIREELAAR